MLAACHRVARWELVDLLFLQQLKHNIMLITARGVPASKWLEIKMAHDSESVYAVVVTSLRTYALKSRGTVK